MTRDNMASSTAPARQLLTIDEVAYCCGTCRSVVEAFVEEELIVPAGQDGEPLFDCKASVRVTRLLRIHHHLDVDVRSLGLVVKLLDRIDVLEGRNQS